MSGLSFFTRVSKLCSSEFSVFSPLFLRRHGIETVVMTLTKVSVVV
jgi:hypothetical protein